MSTSTSTTADEAVPQPRSALIPKLGSLLAFLPLGVWTTWHLWEQLWAFRGPAEWEAHVTVARSALVEVITSTIVLLPIVLHAVWGIRRMFIMKPNLGRYPTFDNIKYILQRISALGLLAFIPAHLWLARLAPQIQHGRHEHFDDLAWHMAHHPPTLVVYLLGVVGVAYHLANGVATGGMTWGYAASPRAMKRMNTISILFFVLLMAAGYGSMYALWSYGRQLPADVNPDETPAAFEHPAG